MKKVIVIQMTLLILFFGVALSWGQGTIPEEAQRHFDRGKAAIEMAKSPDDYSLAIEEFEQAIRLAPDWPDAYYKLGMAQEKAGKYADAITSLSQYIKFAPNAGDTATVKSLINKLEFKAEQVLTDDDVLDIFVSLTDSSKWQLKGITNANLFDEDKWVRSIKRKGQNSLRIDFPTGKCGIDGVLYQDAMLMGKSIDFATIYCFCQAECASGRNYFLEVVSRNKVKMRMRYWPWPNKGGGYDDALFEFVRR